MKFFFFICCIVLFISKTENVFSNNLIYDVNNVEINGKINSNSAKRKLTELAFEKAFIIFIDKVLLKEDALRLYKTKSKTIQDLVLTYQIIKNRKNNDNNDNFIFNIKFDPQKTNQFLAKKNISYADISNISLTLLPILIKDEEIFLYEENFFYKNWNKSKEVRKKKNDKFIRYDLVLENIEDLEYINSVKENINLIDIKKINSFKENKNYILLITYFAGEKFKAFIKTSIKDKNIKKNIDLNFYPKDEKKSYEEAITVLKKEINQIWKQQNLIDVSTPSFLDFFLEIKKIDDYLKLKSILDNIDIVENHSVLQMTNKYFKIRIKYNGKLNKIKNKLLEQKIKIKIIDNVWNLKLIK